MKVLSIANQKGGVAKTTTTYNIAYILSSRGERVLMVDMDPQASLTIYTGLEPYDREEQETIIGVLKHNRHGIKQSTVSLRENLDIIPSRIELAGVENELLARTGRERILSKALQKVTDEYDWVIIDCPPQLSTLTLNALAASNYVLIPCKTDYLAYRGIKQLLETVDTVREDLEISDLRVLGVLATLFETRSNDDKDILDLLKDEYDVIGVIRKTVQAKKGLYDGQSISEFNPKSDIAKDYSEVVDTISSLI